MLIVGDYHIHSKYSKFNHGKNTIEEIVKDAISKGLQEIAITDHGFKHLLFGTNKKNLRKAREEIDDLNKKYPEIRIYLGVEANLITETGEIDIDEESKKLLDICLLGFHKGAYGKFSGLLNIRNLIGNKNSQKRIDRNTNAYIKAIENNKIDVLTHLNEYIKIDAYKIAEACAKNNVFIEINNRHLKLTKQDIEQMLKTDVKFIINSDAHKLSSVAKVDTAIEFAKQYIPQDRIVNISEFDLFKKRKESK